MTTKAMLLPTLAMSSLLTASLAMADDGLENYRDRFEALPYLPPIPADNSLTEEKIALGNMLFFEPRISSSGVISCATCHNPACLLYTSDAADE